MMYLYDEDLRQLTKSAISLFFFKLKALKFKVRYHSTAQKYIKNYLKTHDTRKLHLGAGKNKLSGFINSDIFNDIPIDITKKLPFNDNSFDLIYSSHLIEHVYFNDFKKFLKESYRILKKGGKNIISTPSLEKIAKILYLDLKEEKEIMIQRHKKYMPADEFLNSIHLNNMIHINFGHKYLYDYQLIKYLGKKVGYCDTIRTENFSIPDETILTYIKNSKPQSWNVETETFVLTK